MSSSIPAKLVLGIATCLFLAAVVSAEFSDRKPEFIPSDTISQIPEVRVADRIQMLLKAKAAKNQDFSQFESQTRQLVKERVESQERTSLTGLCRLSRTSRHWSTTLQNFGHRLSSRAKNGAS